ncbi:MAG TPA: hypothetical protein PLO47_02705 [Bacillota bacterium]|nr:hypothetical protein [Bacillota bacterium]
MSTMVARFFLRILDAAPATSQPKRLLRAKTSKELRRSSNMPNTNVRPLKPFSIR